MSRTLTRPMFRKGGMAQREKYMGGGIKAIRPRYMGGGMTGIMSGIQPDARLTPRTGYEEGTKPGFFKSILDALNPTSGEIVQKIQRQQAEPPLMETLFSPSGILEFRTQADADAYLASNPEYSGEIKVLSTGKTINTKIPTETPEGSTSNVPGTPIVPKGSKKIIGTQDVTSDKDELQSYMDMFEAAAGSDPDESRRSKYLELAKFGANLLAQPGGDLIGAVGKAAAPSIGGLSKQMESDRDAKRQLRIAGVQAYLKDQDPGSIGKAVKDIMKSDPSLTMKEALTLAMQTGSATKGATKESRIQEYAEILLGSKGAPEDKRIARALAERIENSGLGFSNFEPLPENPVKDEYYYDTEGKLYKGTEDGVVELNVKK
jgi:hypothetical protein